MRVLSVVVCLFAFAGCAELKQGLKEASEGVEPNMQAIPQGQGWFCSIASDMGWHACARTVEDCKADLDNNKKTAMSQGRFDIKFKDCMQAAAAQCFTRNTMEMQSDGSAKPTPGAECMPDQMSCEHLMEDFKKQSKYSRVSKCTSVN